MKINLAAASRQPSVVALPPSRRGMALVITLILLSVTLVMAVAFLAMSRRERGAVTTATDTTQARLAADSALASAQAQIVANVLTTNTGMYDFHLLVSTTYTNFTPYDQFHVGNVLPRPIVMMTNLTLHSNESRFYLDLNRNGRDDPGTASIAGDPEWIGVLERPDLNPGPNNRFVARYAFFAQPVGNTLDLNYIHNEAGNRVVDSFAGQSGVLESFYRNQGVGSWELNLAAFLVDLNANEWGGVNYQFNWPVTGIANAGDAFVNAKSLLSWRYGFYYNLLATANSYFTTNFANYPYGIDVYSDGPLQTTVDVSSTATPDTTSLPWAGSDNTNRFFALPSELFNTSQSSANFVSHLTNAINSDPYTFYRLLDQIGTDTTADDPRMNLNYDNLDTNGVVIPGAETNLIAWTPLRFFTNAANRLLTNYTARWLAADSNLYAATFNVKTPICLTNIPVLVSNRFVYSPAVNRLLQLAANIYDATTNNAPALGKDYPSVFRPVFTVAPGVVPRNVYISDYQQVTNVINPGDSQLGIPTNILALATWSAGTYTTNVYDVPWIIGVKKGLPNFNQFSVINVMAVTRKLQVVRSSVTSTPTATNQMYLFSISNILGCSLWNSYSNNYNGSITVVARNGFSSVLTNDDVGFTPLIVAKNLGSTNILTSWTNVGWKNLPTFGLQLDTNSFIVALNTNSVVVSNAIYRYYLSGHGLPAPHFDFNQQDYDTGGPYANTLPLLPQFGLSVTNRLQVFILDGTHVIDYVHFDQSPTNLQTVSVLPDYPSPQNVPATSMWSTNLVGGVPSGVIDQIAASKGDINLPPNYWPTLTGVPVQDTPAYEKAFFSGAFRGPLGGAYEFNGTKYYNTELHSSAPYVPVRVMCYYSTWQANDPLVHYLASDMACSILGKTGWQHIDQPYQSLEALGLMPMLLNQASEKFSPWGYTGTALAKLNGAMDQNKFNLEYKDPLVWRSDYWDFPTNKFPTPGWLGRVHRGTPWQTVYLKASDILTEANGFNGAITWTNWTANGNLFDATNSAPISDYYLFDLFTTKVNDNGRRGTLPVNVGSGTNWDRGLAAWSALFSGMVALTNTVTTPTPGIVLSTIPVTIPPAGAGGLNSAVGMMVSNINYVRVNLTNSDGVAGVFEHIGDILRVPTLTTNSPFLNLTGTQLQNGISDELYEWLPQQSLGLLRLGIPPRYVIYCYGQALRPAPNSVNLTASNFGMVTNYQVVAESAARAVLRVNQNVFTNATGAAIGTNYSTTIESYNVLGPD